MVVNITQYRLPGGYDRITGKESEKVIFLFAQINMFSKAQYDLRRSQITPEEWSGITES